MPQRRTCQAIIEPIDLSVCPAAVAALTARRPGAAILETLQPAPVAGRYSIFAADPIRSATIEHGSPAPLRRLAEPSAAIPVLDSNSAPYCGGWIGYISYEAGLDERLVVPRAEKVSVPLVHFGLYDHLLIFDHQLAQWNAAAIDWGGGFPVPPAKARLALLRERLRLAARQQDSAPVPEPAFVQEALSRGQYRRAVDRIHRYIEAGDIYQANLAQRFRMKSELSPFDLYGRVRQQNPASFSAFLALEDDTAIVSASPELFLEMRGTHVVTRPIKGTRPRSRLEATDLARRSELAQSTKERSELNMIVDLLRNDLGRVCEFGSICVVDAGSIEAHPTVFHRVATIEGKLAAGRGWAELLEAAFPGGSIIGAPKIRAMQIIRELEPFPRGPYCGAIGWIGLNGDMTMSVAIRTMLWKNHTVDIFAGGGIVAESDAEAEYEEVMAKAAGLLASLNATPEPGMRMQKVGAA